jgi:predicted HAD superfamily phosphohydrolase
MMSMWHPFGVSPHRPHVAVDTFLREPSEVRARATVGADAAVAVQGGCLIPCMAGWSDMRHMMADAGVHVINNEHIFGVQMDVSVYKPEEIAVKVRAHVAVSVGALAGARREQGHRLLVGHWQARGEG